MKLWCFLHSFQSSPIKYLFLPAMMRALLELKSTGYSVENLKVEFFKQVENFDPKLWDKIYDQSIELMKVEDASRGEHVFQYCFLGDDHYPKWLAQISDPPLAMSYQGPIQHLNDKMGISIVGSREPHELSKAWMRQELYQFIKNNDVLVVSGGARGVDQMAHQMALFLKKPTCVVLPTGLSYKYPKDWMETQKWLDQGVLFMSEMKHSSRIAKQNFAYRNRIIAALTPVTLIVEAKQKSGTLITAHHALMENRELLFVPAHPLQNGFEGSLDLATYGATLVRNSHDLENQIVRI
jgi:DNA processing protein